jgi:GNAT superfamily N-acetyltransferase
MILRPAAPGEAALLARLLKAAFLDYVRGLGREHPGPYDWLPKRIAAGAIHVATDANESLEGMLALSWSASSRVLTVDLLAVDHARQGKGTGRALLTHAESIARDRGATALRLHTVASYDQLLRLYRSAGYVVTHVGPRPNGPDDGHPRAFLVKPLAPEISAA